MQVKWNSTSISLNYTDSYHQDFWNIIEFRINILPSKPPEFISKIDDSINISRCTNSIISLPEAEDPDGDDFVISLGNTTPNWINIQENYKIVLNILQGSEIPDSIDIKLILTDINGAWSNYSFTVYFSDLNIPHFGYINDITISTMKDSIPIEIISTNEALIVDCEMMSIDFIAFYNLDSKSLFVDMSKTKKFKNRWIMIKSTDSCGKPYYSNKFNIIFKISMPPIVTDQFGPLIAYQGNPKLFKIPEDLFYDPNGDKLEFNVYTVSCNSRKQLTFKIPSSLSKYSDSVFVSSDNEITWDGGISATNSYNQSVEAPIQIKVISWSSKLWSKWSGPYEADCFKWIAGFDLQLSGECIVNSEYFHIDNFDFYNINGLIVLISIVIQLLLIFKLGK